MADETGEKVNEQDPKRESLRTSLSFFNDEEFNQWKAAQEAFEGGTLSAEQHQQKLDELQEQSLKRRAKEKSEQEKKAKEATKTKEELDKEKEEMKETNKEKEKKLKEKLNDETKKTDETNKPQKITVNPSSTPPTNETKEDSPKDTSKQDEPTVDNETQSKKTEETKDTAPEQPEKTSSEKKSGSLGLFGGLATIPGAIADRTKGRASSKNYAKNFFWFAAFPTTIATRTAQLGLNMVGDTLRGIFTPKSRKRPWKIDWKQKYAKSSETRKTLRHTTTGTSDGNKKK